MWKILARVSQTTIEVIYGLEAKLYYGSMLGITIGGEINTNDYGHHFGNKKSRKKKQPFRSVFCACYRFFLRHTHTHTHIVLVVGPSRNFQGESY